MFNSNEGRWDEVLYKCGVLAKYKLQRRGLQNYTCMFKYHSTERLSIKIKKVNGG